MITLVEALNYKSMRAISQPIGPFNILVGPNASGKTTFMDIISFLGKVVTDGIDEAVNERAKNFEELVWQQRKDMTISLAIEAAIPQKLVQKLPDRQFEFIRYEIQFGKSEEKDDRGQTAILEERVFLQQRNARKDEPRLLFPQPCTPRNELRSKGKRGEKPVISREQNSNYYPEISNPKVARWAPSYRFRRQKSALGELPADEDKFPVSIWLKNLLANGVQPFVLNSRLIREASPPKLKRKFAADGSNLPWAILDLKKKHDDRYQDWLRHVQSGLPEISLIETRVSHDDKHAYLIVQYQNGIKVPSWLVSDGTLRYLALTLPAYLPDFEGIYLIEEPENGIHPKAVENVYQSLSNVYDAQILLATHSPILLNCAKLEHLLCFAKDDQGATDMVTGDKHPQLRDWRQDTNLGLLFAAGVLG